MDCESPRFQLCQAVADSLGFQDGAIKILVKGGYVTRVFLETGVDRDEPEKMEALRFTPEKREPPAEGSSVVI